MGWHDLEWKHLLDVRGVITSQSVEIVADAMARVLNVSTFDVSSFYGAPVRGEKRSIRVFSKSPFDGGTMLPPMSCWGLASSLWEISHKTKEARYYPEHKK